MAFTDVIDNYADGAMGTLTAVNGNIGYTVTTNATPLTTPNTDAGVRITADGQTTVEVTFDQPVTGVTLSFDRSNPGEIYSILIDGQPVDIQTLIDNGEAEFTTTFAGTNPPLLGTHVIESGGVTSTGNFDNDSLGFLKLLLPVESIAVVGSGGNSGNFDAIEIGIDDTDFTIVCFTADTKIQTPRGPIKVSDLKSGDMVTTQGGSPRAVLMTNKRHVTHRALLRDTRLSPVRIKAGALGGGLPTEDLLVSRQHRILIASRIAKRICGSTEVFLPAIRLVGLAGIDVDRTMQPVDYYHILLDRHDVILANGAPAESLFVGAMSKKTLADEIAEIDTTDVRYRAYADMKPARPFPAPKQAKQVVAAHIKHQRPLLEELLCTAR